MPAKPLINFTRRNTVISKTSRHISRLLSKHTAKGGLDRFKPFLSGKHILDVGVRSGTLTKLLNDIGFRMTALDIVNCSLYEEVRPLLYDGEHMPFAPKSFDVGLLICVLHHCANPLQVLKETMRVARRIIIIEDTYRNSFEKALVSMRDCVGNLEFYQHDYHTTAEWIQIIHSKNWQVAHKEEWSSISFYGMYGRQTLFVIEPGG